VTIEHRDTLNENDVRWGVLIGAIAIVIVVGVVVVGGDVDVDVGGGVEMK
jgi:mannose/fructose/N-acetylgalactosamine-specific phosphotransferase system component IIC